MTQAGILLWTLAVLVLFPLGYFVGWLIDMRHRSRAIDDVFARGYFELSEEKQRLIASW